jgi:hypothetical protein
MSKFTDFYKKLNSDESVKAAFAKAAGASGVANGTKFVDLTDAQFNALIPVAKDAGVDFTLNELKDYFKKSEDGSLSDDELEMVAGGKGNTTEYTTIQSECNNGVGSIYVPVAL